MEPVTMTLFGFAFALVCSMFFIPDLLCIKDIKLYKKIWKDIDSYEPSNWYLEGARIYYNNTRHIYRWVSAKSEYEVFLDNDGEVAIFKDDECIVPTYVRKTIFIKRMKCYRGITQELHKKKWEFLDSIDKQPTLVS